MNITTTAARLAILAALLTIAGCTTQRASTSNLPDADRTTAPPIYPEVETSPTVPATPSAPRSDTSVATLALLRDSEAARQRGDTSSAIAYVERAIRLEPRRPDLWVELAKLQLPDKPVAAERYARKALALAGDNVIKQRAAWLVIADAKQARGDTVGATEIRDRYRTFKG
ncbi:MAG: tetratricopeptide repeat protein [Pseudomonadales bacterium]